MYEILTLGIIAYGILIGCFAILSREHDKLQKGYNSLLQENKELRSSNIELLDANVSLIMKRNSLNVNEFGMKKTNIKL
jgi:hypothetical protein